MEEAYGDEFVEIDLRECIFLIWSKKWLITVFVFLSVLLASIYSFYIVEPVYQAQATIQLSNVEGMYSNPESAVQILKSTDENMPVVKKLGVEHTAASLQKYLSNSLVLEKRENTRMIQISLNNKDRMFVGQLLNGMLKRYEEEADIEYNKIVDNSKEDLLTISDSLDEIDRQLKSIDQDISNISGSMLNSTEKSILMTGLTDNLSTYIGQKNNLLQQKRRVEEQLLKYQPFNIINEPYVLENSISPNKKLNLAIAAVLALMLSVFIVFFIEFMKE